MEDTPTTLDQLKPDPKNPRTLSNHDGVALSKSLDKFGDLSCVVFNRRTQQLVGGHQRIEIMKKLAGEKKIIITQQNDTPDDVGTVAVGYICINDKQFGYRVVDWDLGMQRAANIAANRIQGEFNNDLLSQVVYELQQLETDENLLDSTGLETDEIDSLIGGIAPTKKDNKNTGPRAVEFALDEQQIETVNEALGHIKATKDMSGQTNTSLNANALYYLALDYLDRLHGTETIVPTPQPAPTPTPPILQDDLTGMPEIAV